MEHKTLLLNKALHDGMEQNLRAGIQTKASEDHLIGAGDLNGK